MFLKFDAVKKIKKTGHIVCLYLTILLPIQATFQEDDSATKIILVTPKTPLIFKNSLQSQYIEQQDLFHRTIKKITGDFTYDNEPQEIHQHFDLVQDFNAKIYYILSQHNDERICGGVCLHLITSHRTLKIFYNASSSSIFWQQVNNFYELSHFFYNKLPNAQNDDTAFRKGIVELVLSIVEFGVKFSPEGMIVVTETYLETLFSKINLCFTRINHVYCDNKSNAVCLYIPTNEVYLKELKNLYGYPEQKSFFSEIAPSNTVYDFQLSNATSTREIFSNPILRKILFGLSLINQPLHNTLPWHNGRLLHSRL